MVYVFIGAWLEVSGAAVPEGGGQTARGSKITGGDKMNILNKIKRDNVGIKQH
jgi:hypothetical protein